MTDPEARLVELELKSIVGCFRSFASSLRRDDAGGAASAKQRLEARIEAFCRGKPSHQRQVRKARELLALTQSLTRAKELGKAERAVARLVA